MNKLNYVRANLRNGWGFITEEVLLALIRMRFIRSNSKYSYDETLYRVRYTNKNSALLDSAKDWCKLDVYEHSAEIELLSNKVTWSLARRAGCLCLLLQSGAAACMT